MPYFFAIAGLALFTLVLAFATLGTWLYAPAHAAFPFAWRIWLWGSLGFLAANGLLLAALYPILTNIGISSADHTSVFAAAIGIAVPLGPLLASAVGIVGGGVFGLLVAWRKKKPSRAAA